MKLKISFNQKIRSLQLINLGLTLFGLTYVFLTGEYSWLTLFMLCFLIYGIFGGNLGLHRLFAHRSYDTYGWVKAILIFLGTLTTMGSTIGWSGLHRFHHAQPDTETDPHSPHYVGNFGAWVGIWKEVKIKPSLVSDLSEKPLHRFAHRHYFKIIFVWAILLYLVNPLAVVFAYCMPATFCLNGSSAISVFCHRWGYRNHEVHDHSHNNWLAWVLSLGEGWHNNHHFAPKNFRQGEKKWELDPSAWIIENLLMRRNAEISKAPSNAAQNC